MTEVKGFEERETHSVTPSIIGFMNIEASPGKVYNEM